MADNVTLGKQRLLTKVIAMDPFWITSEPIHPATLVAHLRDPRAGALVTFEGWIRDHNEGKVVTALDYQVYKTLAVKEGIRIIKAACEQFELHRALACHRQGSLAIGDIAVWVGTCSSHRREAFAATEWIIDQIKARLPIWKREHYLDSPPQWVCCQQDHGLLSTSLAEQVRGGQEANF